MIPLFIQIQPSRLTGHLEDGQSDATIAGATVSSNGLHHTSFNGVSV